MNKYISQLKDMAVEYLPNVLLAIVILIIGMMVIKQIMKVVRKMMGKRNLEPSLQKFLSNLTGWILKILLFVAVLEMVGVATTSFIAILGAAGLAVGLALQGTLANFAGGVLLMIFKPYKIGDLVETQGVLGVVKEIQIFNSILLTPENKTAIVPNGAVMNDKIINYVEEGKIRVDLTVGISYDADIRQAKEILLNVMKSDSNVLQDPGCTVDVAELGDNSVNLAVRPWCKPEHYWDVYFGTLEEAKIKLDEAKIGIPYPQRDVHIYNHN